MYTVTVSFIGLGSGLELRLVELGLRLVELGLGLEIASMASHAMHTASTGQPYFNYTM